MSHIRTLTLLLLMSASPLAAHAQSTANAPAPQDDKDTGGASSEPDITTDSDIVVTAEQQRGAVIGDIKPEQTLSPGDIRAYGASSVSELLDALSPQISSGRGRSSGPPVVLLNGQRISGFRELRDLPTEAIARVDILPEEVALKYGYRADQRVVNIVLRERFNAWVVDLDDDIPTQGGTNTAEAESNYLRIRNGGRLNVNLQYQNQSRLLESERGIIPATPGLPYDALGNVTAPGNSGAIIDPALAIPVAGAPVTSGIPAIGDFTNGANVTDTTPYRTLQPATQQFEVNAIYSKRFDDVSATANIDIQQQNSQSYNGLPQVALTLPGDNPFSPFAGDVSLYRYAGTSPLTQDVHAFTGHGGFTLNGALSSWQWSVTGNFDRAETTTYTQTGVATDAIQAALIAGDPAVNPFAPGFLNGDLYRPTDRAKSISTTEEVDTLFTGAPLSLPAGDVNTSIKLGFQNSDYDSRSLSAGILQTGDVGRAEANGQVNIDVPVADADRGVLPFLGHLSLNGNAQVQQLSDFGTLTSIGYGFNWDPIKNVSVLVSVTDEDGAPSAEQLGGATIITPNSRIFDYVTGRTVDITRISGGNPALDADNRHVMKIGLNVQPLSDPDLRLSAEYVKERIDNPIASFPAPTSAIEAAFPDRFVRDGAGNLLSIDSRPINFLRSDRQQLRWGLDFSKRLGGKEEDARGPGRPGGGPRGEGPPRRDQSATQSGDGAKDDQAQQDKGGNPAQNGEAKSDQQNASRSRGGGRGGRFGRRGGGRIQFSLYHTIYLQDRALIRDGLPALDLLDGSATGSSGGQPRHEVELRAGIFKNGLGARLNGDWKSATRVDSGIAGNDSLRFSSIATFDLRLFADLGSRDAWVKDHPWLRGTRVSVSVDNIFNQRQSVTGPDGTVPLSYQPGYVDPLGRVIKVSLRKLFF